MQENLPCKDCITLAICLSQNKGKSLALSKLTLKCTILRRYCLEVGSKTYLAENSEFRTLFNCYNF